MQHGHEILGDTDLETIINDFGCNKMRRHQTFRSWPLFIKHTLTHWHWHTSTH